MKQIFSLLWLLTCTPVVLYAQYALQFGGAITVTDDQIIVGEGRQLLLPGNVFAFDRTQDGTWTQGQVLTPGGETAIGFGRSLASGDAILAVGAPLSSEVYLYSRSDDGVWALSQTISHSHPQFGAALSLKEDHLLIGATGDQILKGAAYLYSRDKDGYWSLTETLVPDSLSSGDRYGSEVLIHGTDLVVSAPNGNSGTGHVLIYSHDDAGEVQMQTLLQNDGAPGDQFGASVTSAGDFLAIGAPGSHGGTVLLYSFDDLGGWTQEHLVQSPDPDQNSFFGQRLTMHENRLWISAPRLNERRGGLYHLDLSEHALSEMLRPEQVQFRSGFGGSMAADGNTLAVGATGHDNFEGAVFPVHLEDQKVTLGEPLVNRASEIASITGDITECESGTAGLFPCAEVDMISFLTRQEIGAQRGIQVNDVWGWEDPETGREYAIVGRTDGTSFIDLTDPYHPIYIGDLPMTSTANQSLWRDIKVYQDHAFIVADGAGAHHMQIFDLTQLRGVTQPQIFSETALYKGVYSSHNIVINEESGFAYAVGSDSGGETCGGALHMINIQDPVNPTFAGCFADTRTGGRGTGATHDAQCVIYNGPDREFQGREICLSSNGTALSIADVTDKSTPVALSVARYPNVSYTHQGWLTEDHRYFYLNDEGDEMSEVVDATRTLIFDVSDLEDPILANEYFGPSSAIDHNLYIDGDLMYQTNYVEGLRIVDISDPVNPIEIGHFDTVPYGPNDNSPVLGAWSNYPYFKSGTIVVTSGREGVFFLRRRPLDL